MFEKWQILVGKQQNFPKCHGFDSQCTKQKEKIVEISHLTIHKTQFNAQSRANGKISQNAMALIANKPNRRRNIRNFMFDHT